MCCSCAPLKITLFLQDTKAGQGQGVACLSVKSSATRGGEAAEAALGMGKPERSLNWDAGEDKGPRKAPGRGLRCTFVQVLQASEDVPDRHFRISTIFQEGSCTLSSHDFFFFFLFVFV